MRLPLVSLSVPRSMRLAVGFGLILMATLRAAWSTLDRSFIGDDFAYVGRFYDFKFGDWPALFLHDWSGGMWGYVLPELRPFAALSFLIDARLWGIDPLGYHITNLVLDTGCACLVALIVWRLHAAALWLGCGAAILFAWHPAHAEPVAWITGRVDLLGTFAYLATFFAGGFFLHSGGKSRWLIAAWLAYAIGCFSKEFCLTAPIALLLWAWIFRGATIKSEKSERRRMAVLFIGFVAVVLVFWACRRAAFGTGVGGVATLSLASTEYIERQFDYLRWFLPPFYHFGRDYRPLLVSFTVPLVVGTAITVVASLFLWRWKGPATSRWRVVSFYIVAWYLIATLPLAATSYFAPRHLYLATAGMSIGIALLLASMASNRWWRGAALAGLALLHITRFDHAVAPWRHAQKVSERVVAEISRTAPQLRAGEILLLDVPDVYEGVWMWSAAVPFALRPPFMPAISNPVLTRPSIYTAPPEWSQQSSLAGLARAPAARLIHFDDQGQFVTRYVLQPELQSAAGSLTQHATMNTETAWREFVSALLTR